MSAIKIQILRSLGEFSEGQVVTVPVDKDGIVLSRFWRRRLKDASSDGFCKIVEAEKAEPEVKTSPATSKKVRESNVDEG